MSNLINVAKIANEVKSIMESLNLTVVDKGLPEVIEMSAEDFANDTLIAVYTPETHQIFINLFHKERFEQEPLFLQEIIAHELVHSFQDLAGIQNVITDVMSDDYWNQQFEIEAMGVGLIWTSTCSEVKDMVINEEGDKCGPVYKKMIESNPAKELLVYLAGVVKDLHFSQLAAA